MIEGRNFRLKRIPAALRGSGFGLRGYVVDGGVVQADLADGTINRDFFKAAMRYAANDFAASYGGRTPVTDVAGTLPTTTTIYAGVGTGANYLGGPMKNLRIARVILSNQELTLVTR